MKHSYVLDTAVLVAAIRSAVGASRQLLHEALGGTYHVLLSVPLMLEYEAVLTREDHLKASGLSVEDVGKVLDDLAAVGKLISLSVRVRPFLCDPEDEMVLETAVNGRAEAIVTFNVRDFARVGIRWKSILFHPWKRLKG